MMAWQELLGADKWRLFGGAILVNPYLFVLDLLLLVHFGWFTHRQYRRTGWKVDFWTIILFIRFVFPVLVMYPFNAAYGNQIAVSVRQPYVKNYVDQAYVLTIIGYVTLFVGRWLYQHTHPHTALKAFLRPLEQFVEYNLRSRPTVWLLASLAGGLMGIMIYFQVTTGNLFNPREYFQFYGTWRPFYMATVAIYPLTLLFAGLRLIQQPTREHVVLAALLFMGIPFLGSRTAVLEPLLFLFGFFAFMYPQKINFTRLALLGGVFLVAIIGLMEVRTRASNVLRAGQSSFAENVFYGNTFSDTRDFGYVIAHWDKELLWGKTYAAGMMGFVPRSLSEFRERWSLGVFTARTTGYDSRYHPGLRPGSFGEAYFNFGVPGIVLLGLLLGFVLMHVDTMIRRDINERRDVLRAYSRVIVWTAAYCFSLSVNFPTFYALVLFMFVLALVRQGLFRPVRT